MRLALIIEHLDPDGGGAERNCVELSHRLVQRGHEVTILCGACTPDAPAKLAAAQPDVLKHASPHQLPGVEEGPAGKPRTALRLWRFSNWIDHRLDEGDFDASLAFHTSAAADVLQPLGGTARATQRRPGRKPAKRFAQYVTPKQVMLRRLEKRTLANPRVKAIAALSEYVRRQLHDLNVPDEKIRLIRNAVELSPPSEQQRQQWRQRVRRGFGIDDNTVAYLFSALNPQLKGVETLLAALHALLNDGQRAVVLLTGGAGFSEQQLAERLGVRGSVRFMGRTQQMPAAFAAADVTVHPTFYDPSSRVVIESLLMGVPAITTRCDGSADFVQEGEHLRGRVIERAGDVAALAEAMKQLAPLEERQRCIAAMNGLADELAISRHVDAIEALLKEVAGA